MLYLRYINRPGMTAMRSEQQVEAALKSYEDVDSWKTIIFLYNALLKEVGTKLRFLMMNFSMYISIIRLNILRQESRHRIVL